MTFTWWDIAFPMGFEAEGAVEVLRTLASEPRSTLLSPRPPAVVETELTSGGARWRIGLREANEVSGSSGSSRHQALIVHLQSAAERNIPGMSWEKAAVPRSRFMGFGAEVSRESGSSQVVRAVELRTVDPSRLMTTELSGSASARLLGVSSELRGNERVLVQWQIGSWLVRSPIPPPSQKLPEPSLGNFWNASLQPEKNSEQVAAARTKQAEHIFGCVGRIAVRASTVTRANQLISSSVGSLQLLRAPGVGVSRRLLPSWWVTRQLKAGHFGVSPIDPPCRLTAAELVGVIGWPVANPPIPGVRYNRARVVAFGNWALIPASMQRPTDRVIGMAAHSLQGDSLVVLRPKDSLRHLHVIGPTGVGKSTLLARMVLADIAAERGVVVIDPKGDLVADIIDRIPKESRNSVVVIDPSSDSPVGFNPLALRMGADRSSGTSHGQKDGYDSALGVDAVLHVMKSVWADSWGPRLGDILHAGLLTLASAGTSGPGSQAHSLAELPMLFTDDAFRRPLVRAAVARDPLGLGTFWPWFEGLSPDQKSQALAPLMNKLRAFLMRPALRNVLGQAEPRFNISDVFSSDAGRRKALLIRLPKGELGSEGAQLLGSLLVAQLWRLTMARSAVSAHKRQPVSLVLDEFQEFLRLPIDLGDALVQARGLGVGLTLAHQHLGQLIPSLRSAVLANVGSRVVFGLDHDDALTLSKRGHLASDASTSLRPEDIMGLPAFEAYANIRASGGGVTHRSEATGWGSIRTLPLPPSLGSGQEIARRVRHSYGIPAAETEKRLWDLASLGAMNYRAGGYGDGDPASDHGKTRSGSGDHLGRARFADVGGIVDASEPGEVAG